MSYESLSAMHHTGREPAPLTNAQATTHLVKTTIHVMHGGTECGLFRPMDLPALAGYKCAPAGESFAFTSARRGFSSPGGSAPSSPQCTCQHHENNTHKQRARTVSAWYSSYGHCGEKHRDKATFEEGTTVRDTSSLSTDVPEHVKNEFNDSSATDKRVVVRIRGMSLNSEKKLALCVHPKDHAKILCHRGTCLQEFHFSRVFGDPDTNEDVYRDIGGDRIVVAVGHGIKETILAYGQTGSGKTHSLFGTGQEKGLTQFFVQSLFGWRSAAGLEQTISLCVIEVLGDMLYDLLPDWNSTPENGSPPEIRWKECFIKTGKYKYKVITVDDEQAALRILEEARQQRKVGGSHLNARSSRSHAIVQFFVHTRFSNDQAGRAVQSRTHHETGAGDCAFYGVLTLADLAGCERELPSYLPRNLTSAAAATSKDEGKWGGCSRALNTSISALNRLIRKMQTGALDESDRRQSALNRVLFDYLQPDCGVCMLFCLNPEASELQVSLSTLTIASDCRLIPCSRKQHLLRLEPLRTLYTYDILSHSADRTRCLAQARHSADSAVCTSHGSQCVKRRGGERLLDGSDVLPDQGSSAETADAEHDTSTRDPDARTRGGILQGGTPDKLVSGVAASTAPGDLVLRNNSERGVPLVAQTRETQTDEGCLCPQAFVTLHCGTKNHSYCSISDNTQACGQSNSVKLPPQSGLNGTQTGAIVMPSCTGHKSADGTRKISPQCEGTWRNGLPCLDACTSEGSMSFHCGSKTVPRSQRGKHQKHAACCSVSSHDITLMHRQEKGRRDRSWKPKQSPLPTGPQSEDTRDCDYLRKERMSQCTCCYSMTDEDNRIKRRHRRCCKHIRAEQLQTVALHHLCQQQEEEIQAEIKHLERKLTSLMLLCASEQTSSRAPCRAPDLKVLCNKASSAGRASQESTPPYLREGLRLLAHCKSDGSPSTANESDRGADDRNSNSNEDTCQQHVGECVRADRRVLRGKVQEERGAPDIDLGRSSESGSQTTLLCENKGQSTTVKCGEGTTACLAVTRTSACRRRELLDGLLAERQNATNNSILRRAKSTGEFRAAFSPAPRAQMSEVEMSSTHRTRAEPRFGCTVQKTRKQPTSVQARLHTDITKESTSYPLPTSTPVPVPEKHPPVYRNNYVLPSIKHSEQSAQLGGKATSALMENVTAEATLRGDTDDEHGTHYLSGMVEQRIASYTSAALTPQQTVKKVSPTPMKADKRHFFSKPLDNERLKLADTQNGCNKGETPAGSVGSKRFTYHCAVSDQSGQVAELWPSLSPTGRSFPHEGAPGLVRDSKLPLEGSNARSCLQSVQCGNNREYRPQVPCQLTSRQSTVGRRWEAAAAVTNPLEWNDADEEFSSAGQARQLDVHVKRERQGEHKWHSHTGDVPVTSSGLRPLLSAELPTATPISIFQFKQAENTFGNWRTPPLMQRDCVDMKDRTSIDDFGEGRRLRQRLRELLCLRQQRRWPQSGNTRQLNSCSVDKLATAPGTDIHEHAEDCIQEELEQIIQRLQGLGSCQELGAPQAHIRTSDNQATPPLPCGSAFEVLSKMQPAF